MKESNNNFNENQDQLFLLGIPEISSNNKIKIIRDTKNNLSEFNFVLKTQELLKSNVIENLLKEIQEEFEKGQLIIKDFFEHLESKKEIKNKLNQDLQKLSIKINKPISLYYFEDIELTYSLEELNYILKLWEKTFNINLNKGILLAPVSDKNLKLAKGAISIRDAYRKIFTIPKNKDLIKWIQNIFDANPLTDTILKLKKAVKYSGEIQKKYQDIDIQQKLAKRMDKILDKLSPNYMSLFEQVSQINFVTKSDQNMSIDPSFFNLNISIDYFLNKENSEEKIIRVLEHELTHIKHNLIIYKEQEENIHPSLQEKLKNIVGEQIPKGYFFKNPKDKKILFFWREQIPDDIFRKIIKDQNNGYSQISQKKVEDLKKDEIKILERNAIHSKKKIVPKDGFILPYAATIYNQEFIFNGRVSVDNFLVEQITVMVQLYNENPKRFIKEAYNIDPKIKRIVDEVLIPYGFIPRFLYFH